MSLDFADDVGKKSNEELIEIYANSWEFQPAFVASVKDELIRREVNLQDVDTIKSQKESISDEVSVGKKGKPLYLVLFIIMTLLGGLIGIIAGYHYSQTTRISITGKKYYVYDQATRNIGRIMMWLGLAVLVFAVRRTMMIIREM